MSYPFIGMRGILPEGEEWDAHHVEKLLRDGHDIYIDEDGLNSAQVVRFQHGKFQVSQADIDNPVYESGSFLEAAVWLAFMGRSFI